MNDMLTPKINANNKGIQKLTMLCPGQRYLALSRTYTYMAALIQRCDGKILPKEEKMLISLRIRQNLQNQY